jgi:hypothetical protein
VGVYKIMDQSKTLEMSMADLKERVEIR